MAELRPYVAIRIQSLPDGVESRPVYFSETGRTHLRVGDVGFVLAKWGTGVLRLEGTDSTGAIDWQDHLEAEHLQAIAPTQAGYPRRRLDAAWAHLLGRSHELMDDDFRAKALHVARLFMVFARRNVEVLVQRLHECGYIFAHPKCVWSPPDPAAADFVAELREHGIHVPLSLQAWLQEIGCVNLCGSHPDWARTGWAEGNGLKPWYTDPLVIEMDATEAAYVLTEWSELRGEQPQSRRSSKSHRTELTRPTSAEASRSGSTPLHPASMPSSPSNAVR